MHSRNLSTFFLIISAYENATFCVIVWKMESLESNRALFFLVFNFSIRVTDWWLHTKNKKSSKGWI